MSKRQRCGPVPDRWLNCPRKSNHLICNKFLAFKTPLSEDYDDLVPVECRFPPRMLFATCKPKKIKIGLWIDLTNTTRFYDKNEIEETDCKYVKLQCRGHGETPSQEQTKIFTNLVHTFISKNPLSHIGVHCTHGFNRTGFLIVSYLVTKMDCSLSKALEHFALARPPGIYKGDYLEELYRRYDDIDDVIPPPQLPDWCNMAQSDDSEYDSGSSKRFKSNVLESDNEFMKGVPGVTLVTDRQKAQFLQRKIQQMCEWKGKNFPGAQPVSMDIDNIRLLNEKSYRVSWKADGTRYMMLIDKENEIYFFDRDSRVFQIRNLKFPHRKENRHLKNTLLDGEMVIDKVNGEEIPRYLAYDIIKFDGQDVSKMPFFPTRLHCLENEIIRPRHIAMEKGVINKAQEPFSIRKKEFWDTTQAANLLGEKFAKNLSHEPDGLIFQPSKEPYTAGPCSDVLKWKPLDMNSIDFRLKIVMDKGVGIISKKVGHLYVGQLNQPFAMMRYTKDLKDLNNKIIECKFENNEWKFMRERTDKSFPNSYNTAQAVIGSIRNPVTKEGLLDYIRQYRFEDDSFIMPPPPPKPKSFRR